MTVDPLDLIRNRSKDVARDRGYKPADVREQECLADMLEGARIVLIAAGCKYAVRGDDCRPGENGECSRCVLLRSLPEPGRPSPTPITDARTRGTRS